MILPLGLILRFLRGESISATTVLMMEMDLWSHTKYCSNLVNCRIVFSGSLGVKACQISRTLTLYATSPSLDSSKGKFVPTI